MNTLRGRYWDIEGTVNGKGTSSGVSVSGISYWN